MNPDFLEIRSPEDCEVAIVGAGFSGSMLAVHLAAAPDPPRIALVEKSPVFGPGIAYGKASREHLLNVPVEKMGAFPDRPGHFLDWVRDHPEIAGEFGLGEILPGAFLPRKLYGKYLETLLDEAQRSCGTIERVRGEVVDVERVEEGGFLVRLAGGASFRARDIALAWGNLPPRDPRGCDGVKLLEPWSEEARSAIAEGGELLIIGSGLTCLDLLVTAANLETSGKIHVLSRHGRFPQDHRVVPPVAAFLDRDSLPSSVREIFRLVREKVRASESSGGDWRAVVDALRPVTQELWCGLDHAERARFLMHVKPIWEVLRHRAAPEMRRAIGILESREALVRHRGRIRSIERKGDLLRVSYLRAGSGETRRFLVRTVINATGPETDAARSGSILLRNLIRRNLIGTDPLGLGIRVDAGETGDEDPMLALGSLRRGILWESTAVPELRTQAAEIAGQILARRRGFDPGHFYLFEI